MSSDFLVNTATLRRVIEQSAITPQFREVFMAWLTDHGTFVDNTIPSVKLGMLIGEMTAENGVTIGDDMNTVFGDIRNLDKLPFVKLFHLGELITIAGGQTLAEAPFVANEGMDGLRAIISYMTGAGMMSDSAVLVLAPSCRTSLLEQHPWLSEIDVSVVTPTNADAWLTEQVTKYGERHPVAALVNTINPAESVSDLHMRDAKMMRLKHPIMKTTSIAATDVGKIFVVSIDGQTSRIMPRDEFLSLPIESYDCWKEISKCDINQR